MCDDANKLAYTTCDMTACDKKYMAGAILQQEAGHSSSAGY